MGRHFLSVLGTGNYSQTNYACEEGAVNTAFIQEAVLKLKMPTYTKEDRISIFVTEQSYQKNWLDKEEEKIELDSENVTEKNLGLGSILKREFDETGDSISVRIIPLGASETELWEIFNIIYDEIGAEEELYVDITHSLRNIPVQMLSVIAYARVLKKVNVAGIYYGAFEARTKNGEGTEETPIFDLITFLDILDWSQAANSFVKYGNSDEIKELYQRQKGKSKNKKGDISKVITKLSNITQGLETSRGCLCQTEKSGKICPGQSVLNSYRAYQESYQMMQKENEKVSKEQRKQNQVEPLSRLFDVINEKLEPFDVENNLEFGFAAIEWAIENKKTQQGFTALDETIKTWLCCHYHLDEFSESHRDGICKRLCNLMNWKMQKDHKMASHFTEADREEIYEEWKEDWVKNQRYRKNQKNYSGVIVTSEQELEIAHQIIMELPGELARLGKEIGSCRNSMSHFGYSNLGRFSCDDLYNYLVDYYNQFKKLIKQIEENT